MIDFTQLTQFHDGLVRLNGFARELLIPHQIKYQLIGDPEETYPTVEQIFHTYRVGYNELVEQFGISKNVFANSIGIRIQQIEQSLDQEFAFKPVLALIQYVDDLLENLYVDIVIKKDLKMANSFAESLNIF